MVNRNSVRLLLCGLSALYWELVLIRWLSACVRILAYYSNFVLISAFFGLGAGALLTRYRVRLHLFIVPAITLCIVIGLALGGFHHESPLNADEYIWQGSPRGVSLSAESLGGAMATVSVWPILVVAYLATAFVFLIFGQWIGLLFKPLPSLRAYSVEITGSILGILLFALLSWLQCSPVAWLVVGFAPLFLIIERGKKSYGVAALCCIVALLLVGPYARQYVWSPYYKIHFEPLDAVYSPASGEAVSFTGKSCYTLTVNNDFHQMMMDLRPRGERNEFLDAWRDLYEAPYRDIDTLPEGSILIVGAGTGNDVSAALRRTTRDVHAVEIDPAIVDIGRRYHFEQPYQNPRVTAVVDDARSFFHTTPDRYALVVFGFLDSHRLLSSFSSVRLDNFVYTRESLEQVKRILEPGGKVYLTFASNRSWIHHRLVGLLDQVFGGETKIYSAETYVNGIVYANAKARAPGEDRAAAVPGKAAARAVGQAPVVLATDDWPFLYLREPTIPAHYRLFILVVLVLGFASLGFLPRGERRIRLPYFFLGAAFFLIETSNVISLSLLYGSTWTVNVLVFTGILALILLGNLTSARLPRPYLKLTFALLAASLFLAWLTPTSALLSIRSAALTAVAGVVVFLGPVYFASLIFAALIKDEENLYQAYGSNLLGAVVGGACEYASLMFGFKFLLLITFGFYLAAFVMLVCLPRGVTRADA
jgi:SAM-dependent methyltransferase